jgi:dTDP-4-amino-4,6-dideoxygalactose transaminase
MTRHGDARSTISAGHGHGVRSFDRGRSKRQVARKAHAPLAILGGDPSFSPGVPFARPARPPLERIIQRLAPAYESGLLTNGALVAELEERVADKLGVPHVVAVSSCTSGLILALQALIEDRPGPVVVPSFTFMATGLAVTWNNRPLRLVGCDPETFQMSFDDAAEVLDGASALVPTHVFGAPCQPDVLEQTAAAAGVPLLFDAAHAFGASSRGRLVGGFGDAEVFSLTPTKVLVAGEGGLVTTRDAGLAQRLRATRNYGNRGDYNAAFAGLNARLSEFHAAMALESMAQLDSCMRARRHIATMYKQHLAPMTGVSCQVVPATDESTVKDFAVTIDEAAFGIGRDLLADILAAEGIETRNYFDPPLHTQPVFADAEPAGDLSTVEHLSRSIMCVPVYPDLSLTVVERIIEVIGLAHDHAGEIASRCATAPA